MSKRVVLGIAAGSFLLALIWIFRPGTVVEPSINGRSASEWIRALGNAAERDYAKTNLTELGGAGIPYIVVAIRQASSVSTKAHSKAVEISPAMRKLLSEPFPWKYVREELVVILGDIGRDFVFSNETAERAATPQIQIGVEALTLGLADADRNYRRLCATALWGTGPNARPATDALLKMFAEGDKSDKILICQALGNIGVDETTATPVATALGDTLRADDINLKVAAIEALAGLDSNGKEAVPKLLRLLNESSSQPGIYGPMLRSLARIGNLPPESRLKIQEFIDDKDLYARAGAAIALLRIDPTDERAKKIVVECLGRDMPKTLRTSTIYLITGMHREAVIFRDELTAWAGDEEELVAKWSRQALGELRPLGNNEN